MAAGGVGPYRSTGGIDSLPPPMRGSDVRGEIQRAIGAVRSALLDVRNVQRAEDMPSLFERCGIALAPLVERSENPRAEQLQAELTEKIETARFLHGPRLHESLVDIFLLFLELLSILNEQQVQEKIHRNLQRDLQAQYGEKQAVLFDDEASFALNTAIGTGVMSILAACCPLLQHSSAGATLMRNLPEFMKQAGANQSDFFNAMRRMMNAGAKISSSTKDIQSLKSQTGRVRAQVGQEHARNLNDDETRNVTDSSTDIHSTLSAYERLLQLEQTLTQALTR